MWILPSFSHWQSNRMPRWWRLGHHSSAVFFTCFSASLQLVLNFDPEGRNDSGVALSNSYSNLMFNHTTQETAMSTIDNEFWRYHGSRLKEVVTIWSPLLPWAVMSKSTGDAKDKWRQEPMSNSNVIFGGMHWLDLIPFQLLITATGQHF